MLKELYINNYVLIDSLKIDFPEGLVIITGQTGAGKSIILGALSAVAGGKTDATMVSEGAENCVIEAVFVQSQEEKIFTKELLEANNLEWDINTEELIIRRLISKNGRSRAFINDMPIQIPLLQSLTSKFIDIHSQHQSLMIADKRYQLSVLDRFAGNNSLLEECKSTFNRWTELKAELSRVQKQLELLSSNREYIQSRFEQLEQAKLREGELEELEAEQKKLSNAENIKRDLSMVEDIFSPMSQGADEQRLSIEMMLKESSRLLLKNASLVGETQVLAQRIDSSRIELLDVLSEVSYLNSKVELSEERLQIVEERLSLLYDLLQKHSCKTIDELIEQRERLSNSLYDSTELEQKKENLEKTILAVENRLKDVADELHNSRMTACQEFSKAIISSIHFLEMERAVFDIEVKSCPLSETGSDLITFRFSSNGTNPIDLAKCASGGELSRIMLSLKAMMAKYGKLPTMIFDEIDTGVSGSVADKMGTMICEMGEHMQVFAITHLPQVAAKGKVHYLVEKNFNERGKSTTTLYPLDREGRLNELARMLSGSQITAEAIANAKTLLNS